MRKQFYPLVCLAPLVAVALATAPASGALFLPFTNWSIDLSGTPGSNTSLIQGIDRVRFDSINHVVVGNESGGNPNVIEVGDLARVEGVINATAFTNLVQGTVDDAGLGGPVGNANSWELTGAFSTTVRISGVTNDNGNTAFFFNHEPDASSFLELFIDEYGSSGGSTLKASTNNLSSYFDGFSFAAFEDSGDPATGGFQPLSGIPPAGVDVAVFDFLFGENGVLFDADGNDLIAAGLLQSLQSIQSLGLPNPSDLALTDEFLESWASIFGSDTTPNAPLNFFSIGDGNAQISVVPEPSSLALAVIGATAMVGCFWRRRRLSQPVVE